MVKLKKYKNPQRKMENKQLIKRRDKRLIMDYLLTMTLVTILIMKMNTLNKMRKKIKIYSRTLDRRKQRKKIIKNNNNKSNLSKILKSKNKNLKSLHQQLQKLNRKKQMINPKNKKDSDKMLHLQRVFNLAMKKITF